MTRYPIAASIVLLAWCSTASPQGRDGALTTQGSMAAPADGSARLPGGAPGVQREPLNASPDANRGAHQPPPAPGRRANPNAQGGVDSAPGQTMSADEIWQACMMKPSPQECRTRLQGGVPDRSIERNPP
jgi:hypothetical protein